MDGWISKRIRELKNTVPPQYFFQNINMYLNAINHPLDMIFCIKIAKIERFDHSFDF